MFDNTYLEKRTNRLGGILSPEPSLAKYTRRGLDLDTYYDRRIAEPEDVNNIRQAMKSAKGPGNFRNLFVYSPNGKKDGIQVKSLSEVAAKDEFLNIKT